MSRPTAAIVTDLRDCATWLLQSMRLRTRANVCLEAAARLEELDRHVPEKYKTWDPIDRGADLPDGVAEP